MRFMNGMQLPWNSRTGQEAKNASHTCNIYSFKPATTSIPAFICKIGGKNQKKKQKNEDVR